MPEGSWATDPLEQARRRRPVYRAPVSNRVVVEHPVVVGGQGFIGTSHEIVFCQTAPELLICTHHDRCLTGLPSVQIGGSACMSQEQDQ